MKTATDQSNQPSNTTLQVFKSEINVIEEALKISNDKPITEYEFAKIAGFNDTEIKMIKMFWNPVFNQSWIYLSDEMILEYLTNENKESAIANFYRRILLPNYQEEIDYQEVSSNNDLVKSYLSNLANENKVKPSNRKKYYIVSGEAYKCMLMASKCKKGKEIRMYYIKVENLARQMKDYIMALLKQENDKKTKENTRLLKLHNQMTQKHQYYKFKTKGPVFYIIISGLEYKDNIIRVKIGIAGCQSTKVKNCPNCDYCFQNKDESDSLDSRLANHRTLWPQLQVKFVVFTPDASLLEKCIKREFRDKINPHGHELVYNVEPEKIILETMKYLNMFNLYNKDKEYLIANDIEEYNVNALSHMKSIDNEFSKNCEDITEFIESQNSFEPNKIDISNVEEENKVDLVDNKDEEESDTENILITKIKNIYNNLLRSFLASYSYLFTI
jgi:phage anti-repressor protein